MLEVVKPDFKYGAFYISYDEIMENELFYSLNICKTKHWEEIRIKGKFVKI